jgi:hypothetical protein
MKTVKYVVLLEIPASGYIDCIAVCESIDEAFGQAYLKLCGDKDQEKFYITIPMQTEGENGFLMECRFKGDDSVYESASVLMYRQEER